MHGCGGAGNDVSVGGVAECAVVADHIEVVAVIGATESNSCTGTGHPRRVNHAAGCTGASVEEVSAHTAESYGAGGTGHEIGVGMHAGHAGTSVEVVTGGTGDGCVKV